MNEFSDWKIATGLEHTVRYLKPVKPDVNYQVTGVVNFEEIWKNPKYTHLKMENILKEEASHFGQTQTFSISPYSFLIIKFFIYKLSYKLNINCRLKSLYLRLQDCHHYRLLLIFNL